VLDDARVLLQSDRVLLYRILAEQDAVVALNLWVRLSHRC
jgi:hypothetical protein